MSPRLVAPDGDRVLSERVCIALTRTIEREKLARRCDPLMLRAQAARCRALAVRFDRAASIFEKAARRSVAGTRTYSMSTASVTCPACGWQGRYLSKHVRYCPGALDTPSSGG